MSGLRFGTRSRAALGTADQRLVVLSEESLLVGMDFSVLWGWRDEAKQNELVSQGLSRTPWPNSKHNRMIEGKPRSAAIDVAPWPIDWRNAKRFYHLVGIIRATARKLDLAIRCGLDWDGDFDLDDQTFFDLGHIELIG